MALTSTISRRRSRHWKSCLSSTEFSRIVLVQMIGAGRSVTLPGSQEKTETSRSLRPPGQGKADRVPNNPSANGPALPKDWDQIDLNHLVLAKDDGRGRGWWEAIPIEKAGDDFKLRWRDHASLPPISRSRLGLALIYPNAA